ncbi:carbamate kinase [Marinomonas flavescens]|uniref:carbamate kinase n=1 Tax=Marinomonas flavescens TaxID=2529379 RepID=UPI001055FEA8|nr:carbamate kinase [Marinomonas flavescens]
MRIVVALGGNALLKRGEPLTAQAQRANIKIAAQALAKIAVDNELIITHGNGPQVGLLALQGNAYKPKELYPLDVLGAETEGMIGYMIEQEMGNLLPSERPIVTLLTMVEVDSKDPAFSHPAKFIGPVYDEDEAQKIAKENNWFIKPDGDKWRRVVPSPLPKRIFEIRPIRWLLEKNTIVIASGGGGIPTMFDEAHHLQGVEAVIDKDLSSELLARELNADLYIMATDAAAVFLDWNTPKQRGIKQVNPEDLAKHTFAEGSMGPKVSAACQFAQSTGKTAAIGSLEDLEAIVKGLAGTHVNKQAVEMTCY